MDDGFTFRGIQSTIVFWRFNVLSIVEFVSHLDKIGAIKCFDVGKFPKFIPCFINMLDVEVS